MADKIQVVVTTAQELTPEQEKLLKNKLSKKLGKSFQLVKRVAHELIGGLKLTIGNKVKDATIGGKLAELESQLNKVQVTTAIELDKKQKEQIKKELKRRYGELDYEFKVDPKVLGGIKLSVGFNEYDATLKTKLEKLKTYILEKL